MLTRREKLAAREMDQTRSADPEHVLIRKERATVGAAKLAQLLSRVRLNDRERALVSWLLGGLDPAEAMRQLGLEWSVWQGLVRKLQRARNAA